jgi:hypothetical protein
MAEDYLDAARNKIGIARRYLARLNELREGVESEREEVQLDFEGVLASGSSAADQLAEAIVRKLRLSVRNASPERVLYAVDEQKHDGGKLAPCLELLREWANEAVVVDAHRRRNRAVHHYYKKRPYKPELTWMLNEVRIGGEPSPYKGPLDVHSYCANYIAALAKLEVAVLCVEDAI